MKDLTSTTYLKMAVNLETLPSKLDAWHDEVTSHGDSSCSF
jgi:hypothetical protein